MSSIKEKIIVRGSTDKLFDALTSTAGYRGWWSKDCQIAEKPGGESRLKFDKNGTIVSMRFRVDEVVPKKSVRWTCVGHDMESGVGTTLNWALSADGNATEVSFEHAGWKGEAPSPSYKVGGTSSAACDRSWRPARVSPGEPVGPDGPHASRNAARPLWRSPPDRRRTSSRARPTCEPLSPCGFREDRVWDLRPLRARLSPFAFWVYRSDMDVPSSLRRWFVIHFAVDVAFAVPLILVPAHTMRLLGWTTVDPVATRLVGAALAAIGLQSLFGRNHPVEAFRAMLGLKCIWSAAAIVGLALSLAEGAPPLTWALLGTFVAFAIVWNYYRIRLRQRDPAVVR